MLSISAFLSSVILRLPSSTTYAIDLETRDHSSTISLTRELYDCSQHAIYSIDNGADFADID
jgi:hypothetical protein